MPLRVYLQQHNFFSFLQSQALCALAMGSSLAGLVLARSPPTVQGEASGSEDNKNSEPFFLFKLRPCSGKEYVDGTILVKASLQNVTDSGSVPALSVGSHVVIHHVGHAPPLYQCFSEDIAIIAKDKIPDYDLAPLPSLTPLLHPDLHPLNYSGVLTRSIDEKIGLYKLDGCQLLIAPTWTSFSACHRQSLSLYNLAIASQLAPSKVLVYCPIFSSGVYTDLRSVAPKFSAIDGQLWKSNLLRLQGHLRGICSSSYFTQEPKSWKLFQKFIDALQTDQLDISTEFMAHAKTGSCRFCTRPVLPNFLQSSLAFDNLVSTASKNTVSIAMVRGEGGFLLGKVEVCANTGRLLVRDSFGSVAILLKSCYKIVDLIDSLIIVRDFISVVELVAGVPTRYLVVNLLSTVSRLSSSKNEQPPSMLGLLIVRSVRAPFLVDQAASMQSTISCYQFGTLCITEDSGKIQMTAQQSTEIGISAKAHAILDLAVGDILAVSPLDTSVQPIKVSLVKDRTLPAKKVHVLVASLFELKISCSEVAYDYLQKSQELLQASPSDDSIAFQAARQQKKGSLLSVHGTIVEKTISGDPLGPMASSSKTTRLCRSLFEEHGIGLPLPCFSLVLGLSELSIPPIHHCKVVLDICMKHLYPLGLTIGKNIKISGLRLSSDSDLLTFTSTAYTVLQLFETPRPSLVPVQATLSPVKFVHELAQISSDTKFVTLVGRFCKLESFELQCFCKLCRAKVVEQSCLQHGRLADFNLESKLKIVYTFTDGSWECELFIRDVNLLKYVASLDEKTIKSLENLPRAQEIFWRGTSSTKSTVANKGDALYQILGADEVYMNDWKLQCRLHPPLEQFRIRDLGGAETAVIPPRQLDLISIQPVNYLEASEKLLELMESSLEV